MLKKPPNLFDFWNELKRRKVVKASLVYLAVAFTILQAAESVFPRLNFPDWTVTFVFFLLIIVFILVIVLTWVYDITPEGIKVTRDQKPEQQQEETELATAGPEALVPGINPQVVKNEADLQQKVKILEVQLKEARKASMRSLIPILIKKLAMPVLIIVTVLLIVLNKQGIVRLLGFGEAKREIAKMHVQAASGFIDQGNFDAANIELEKAMESDPDYSYIWSSLAAISYKQGDLNKAILQTVKSLDLDPLNHEAAYNLAFALEDKKDYHQAIEWYSKAIKADSTLVPAYSALGRLYNMIGQPVDAILILNHAKNKYPDSDLIYLIYKNLGNSHLLMNQTGEAIKYLELSIGIRQDVPETNLFLARAYEVSGRMSKSIEQWDKYIELETDTSKASLARKHLKEITIRHLQEIMK